MKQQRKTQSLDKLKRSQQRLLRRALVHSPPIPDGMLKQAEKFRALVKAGVLVHAPEEPSDFPDPDYGL